MKLRPGSLLLFSAIAGFAAGPLFSQVRPMGVVTPPPPAANQPKASAPKPKPGTSGTKVAPDAPVPGNPDYQPDQSQAAQAAPVPPPLPPAVWDLRSASELVVYIQQVGVEGLNPADYDPAGPRAGTTSAVRAAASGADRARARRRSSILAWHPARRRDGLSGGGVQSA